MKDSMAPTGGAARRNRLAGSLLVVAVAFSLPFFGSLRVFIDGVRPYAISQIAVAAGVVQMLLSLFVLAYVLAQRGLGLRDLGFRFSAWDLPVALILLVVGSVASRFAYAGEWYAYGAITGHAPALRSYPSVFDDGFTLMVTLFVVIDPFVEELIGRAFIISEVDFFTSQRWLGVLISVAVTSSYHLYEGWVAIAPVATLFLVFAIYYARARRVWPIIIAHLAYDLIVLAQRLDYKGF
ncbi:MAG: CPBP family intramembrane glutamic endopeptidase [Acidiferrobacteraceae bacterium]